MVSVFTISVLSVLIVSTISVLAVLSLSINAKNLKTILIYLISFSAGALLADAFLHLLPDIVESSGLTLPVSLMVLAGIIIFFALEKIIHWQHCHMPITNQHVHPFAYVNLLGDALHNFLDGVIIATGYLISFPAGLATTVAVILHEIPQEIGDFGVLLHGGFSKGKALLLNFLTALTALLGALIALWLHSLAEHLEKFLVPLSVGGFIYIACSDLIPEMHKETSLAKSLLQIISFILGAAIMFALLYLE